MNQKKIVSVNAEQVSNKKIGWGVKRDDNHEQLDVGATNRKILEANKNNY